MCLFLVFFILKLFPQIKEGRKGWEGEEKEGKEKGNEIKKKERVRSEISSFWVPAKGLGTTQWTMIGYGRGKESGHGRKRDHQISFWSLAVQGRKCVI